MAPKSGPDGGSPSSYGNGDGETVYDDLLPDSTPLSVDEKVQPVKRRIVWRNVVLYTVLHVGAFYGLYQAMFHAMWKTLAWSYLLYVLGGLGITAGAHRLWAHRSYKAKAPLRFILMIFNCIALQNHVIEWARDHRVHHKYSETDADPHDATRGFFFSHMGWLLVRKHPNVIKRGKAIDLSDLYNSRILRFQKKYYWPLAIFLSFIMPTMIPVYFWGENAVTAYFTAGIFRCMWLLHCTWAINSFAHMFGSRPYDKNINPRQNIFAAFWSLGEGWHNYHHVFPFDYRASEFPYTINFTTLFIDVFASIGWAYDRKSVSKEMVEKKKLRSGELSHHHGEAVHSE